ncbi:MAG: hypothetical protein J7L23_03515 [Candidatus Diapherotrites archaeon]|nr:hypothetical protein [Candidatus Diapherotrites archaeon]
MPTEEEEIINLIAEELESGKPPEMIVEELVQAGLPRGDAEQVVSAVGREISKRAGGQPRSKAPARAPPRGGLPWGYILMIIAILVLLYILLYT